MQPGSAVIFDMDGLLVDSEPWWRRVEAAVFQDLGVPLTDAMCATTKGLRIEEVVAHWRIRFPWSGPSDDQIVQRIVSRMATTLREQAEPKPGVDHAVQCARASGATLALASSSHRVLIDAVLERLGLESTFDVVRSGQDEPHGKPHPGIFISTAADLSCSPRDCVVIEDSAAGFVAARAARMRCIGVPEEPVPESVLCEVVLRSLTELEPRHFARNV